MEKVARKEKVPDTTTVTQTIAMMIIYYCLRDKSKDLRKNGHRKCEMEVTIEIHYNRRSYNTYTSNKFTPGEVPDEPRWMVSVS